MYIIMFVLLIIIPKSCLFLSVFSFLVSQFRLHEKWSYILTHLCGGKD